MLCYMVAYLDRVNIGYAQLQMKQLLHFSDAVYGLGAGIFFVGYFLCEVPSNLLLERIGARKTLLRIMLCWGTVASLMMFISTPLQFYLMRFVLGMFEAGFFPGVILYFTYWFPARQRAQVMAIFMSAAIAASLVAGPLCGAILQYLQSVGGLAGWQWLFLLQGLPAVVLGLVVYVRLDDTPAQANWLTSEQKAQISQDLAAEIVDTAGTSHHAASPLQKLRSLLRDPMVYAFGLTNFLMVGATYALVFWLPSLVRGWGINNLAVVGLITAIPNLAGIIGMLLISRRSDRRRERRWHFLSVLGIAILGLAITVAAHGALLLSLLGLSVALVGVASTTPLFMTLISEHFSSSAAAGSIGGITSLGILGGAVSSAAIGVLSNKLGSVNSVLGVAIVLFAGAALVLMLATRKPRQR
nr:MULTISPECIES: MFS transporter [unclassified Herbaspirillum]